MTLREWTAKITPPDAAAMEEARRRQAQLAKPPAVSGGSKTSPCSSRGSPGVCITGSKKSIFSFLPPTTALWTRAFRARRAP